MHIALALRRRVRFSRLGAPEGSKFRAGVVTNRKIRKFLIPEKSISKTDFQVKKYNFSPPAPKCTFDRSATRRVQVFCTSSLPCDAGFDFSGSERAKGSRKSTLSWPLIKHFWKGASNRGPLSKWSAPTSSAHSVDYLVSCVGNLAYLAARFSNPPRGALPRP